MNAADILFLGAGFIAVFAGLISVTTEPAKAQRVTDPMFWVCMTFIAFGFLFLFAESAHRA